MYLQYSDKIWWRELTLISAVETSSFPVLDGVVVLLATFSAVQPVTNTQPCH